MKSLKDFFLKFQDLSINSHLDLEKIFITIVLFIGVVILVYLVNRIFRFTTKKIYSLRNKFLKPIKINDIELISRQSLQNFLKFFFDISQLLVLIVVIYYFFNTVFTLFPWAESNNFIEILNGILLLVLVTKIAKGMYKVILNIYHFLTDFIPVWIHKIPKSFRFKNLDIMQPERLGYFLLIFLKFIRAFSLLILFLSYISVILGLFSWTKGWSDVLFQSIFKPVKFVGISILNYIPNLLFLMVLFTFTYYANSFLKFFFNEVEKGKIKLSGFNREWSDTTFKLIRFLLIVFIAVVSFPYLPGADSDAFKGISIFLGVLLSLGSTSIVANVVAGVVMTYMLPFRVGDRVKIGETTGDVIEKNLLVTRIKTPKNVIVTIPNSSILGNQILNYSSSAVKDDVILHTAISLGYDIPWRKVHSVLLKAALKSAHILEKPEPFVLQTKLDDFYIVYELNAYTNKPHAMATIYSSLHQNIQDECVKAGIEILSPHFRAHRDGESSTIPEETKSIKPKKKKSSISTNESGNL